MHIRDLDAALAAGTDAALAAAQARGHPLPACLLGIELARLCLGAGAVLALALSAQRTSQDVAMAMGAALYSASAVGLVPVYRAEWAGWDRTLRDHYVRRGRRILSESVAGRLARLALVALLTAIAAAGHALGGIPLPSVPVSALVAALLWIDVLSVYAACARPRI